MQTPAKTPPNAVRYMDMYQVMKVLVETGYSNTMIVDHRPRFVEGNASLRRAGDGVCDRVYALALLQGAVERAEADSATRLAEQRALGLFLPFNLLRGTV